MSAIAVGAGTLLYWLLQRNYNLHLHVPSGWTARLVFTKAMDGLLRACGVITARTENGSLQRYVAWLLGTALVAGAAPLVAGGLPEGTRAPCCRPRRSPSPCGWCLRRRSRRCCACIGSASSR